MGQDKQDQYKPSPAKDAGFAMLGILAYRRYVPAPSVKPFKLRWVLLGLFVFVLGFKLLVG